MQTDVIFVFMYAQRRNLIMVQEINFIVYFF